jgi:pseudouridine synthase
MASERVQKILAQAGIASRRKAEELIQEGLVTINGKLAQLGDKAEWGKDAIKVKGKLLLKPETILYLAFYKPKRVISMMSDPEGRPTLSDFLTSIKTRLFPVGRLDFNSEGLILLTNDGQFSEKLQKREDIPRVYSVKVKGHPDAEMMARLERGGRIGEQHRAKYIKPHSVKIKQDLNNKAVIELVMLGSGAFDVKELFDSRGFLVEKITRTAIGHLTLRGILPGKFKTLTASQVEALLVQPELGMKRLEFEEAKAAEKKPRALTERAAKAAAIKIIPKKNSRATSSDRRTRTKSASRVIKPLRK